ncbi:hypothetical protein Pint_24463 [Pistacia integerrima]|uniref:Uncharacterized protein n=1 Tax=Pistacia integerrima TaxID=434235 RepID=A0ACC0YAJ0_9ROSI|nr:hypothetical protein Pint_24463 [Pistacia integerrima]
MAFQARQADHYNRLAKIGREGFALLEELELIRPPKKFGNSHQPTQARDFHPHPQHYNKYQYEHHQPAHYNNYQYEHHQSAAYIYRGPQIITVLKEPVIDCNRAAQLYDGKVSVDHSIRKQIPDGGY